MHIGQNMVVLGSEQMFMRDENFVSISVFILV